MQAWFARSPPVGMLSGLPTEWHASKRLRKVGVDKWTTSSLSDFGQAVGHARRRGPITAPSPAVMTLLCDEAVLNAGVDWGKIGTEELRARVKPHQVDAVNRAVEMMGGRCILYMPMGTGKSLVLAVVAAHYGGSVLVVASGQDALKEEFKTWTNFTVQTVNGASASLHAEVVISTYKSAMLNAEIRLRKWTTVIVDESHKLAGDCFTSRGIVKLCTNADRVLMVSGTPQKARPRDLYNQLRGIRPDVFPCRESFERRYCDAGIGRFGFYEAVGDSHTEELRAVVERLGVTCPELAGLPPKTIHDVEIDVGDHGRRCFSVLESEYRELSKKMDAAPARLKKSIKLRCDVLFGRMCALTGELKVIPTLVWLRRLLADRPLTDKVVVFAHNVGVVDAIHSALIAYGVVKIDGGTPAHKRHQLLAPIRDIYDPSVRVAVLTLGTSAESITLSPGGCVVVMVQFSLTPSINDQAYARVYRQGQTRPVDVYRLLAKGTHDEVIERVNAKKSRVNAKIFKCDSSD